MICRLPILLACYFGVASATFDAYIDELSPWNRDIVCDYPEGDFVAMFDECTIVCRMWIDELSSWGFKRFVLYHKMCGPSSQGRCRKATEVPQDDLNFLGENGYCNLLCPSEKTEVSTQKPTGAPVSAEQTTAKPRAKTKHLEWRSPARDENGWRAPRPQRWKPWRRRARPRINPGKRHHSYKWDPREYYSRDFEWVPMEPSKRGRIRRPRSEEIRAHSENDTPTSQDKAIDDNSHWRQ